MGKKRTTKGAFGFTSLGKRGGGGGRHSARAGEIFAPPSMKGPAGSPHGLVSKTNNDGNLATRQSPHKRPRIKSICFITTACAEARGLPDDCYELRLLRLFRKEYVAKLPNGEEILAEYREKAPKVVAAVEALGEEEAARVWEDLYERGVARSVALILNGAWDEAFEVYATTCQELEARFLAPERCGEKVAGAPR
jgi:hypothetical protein